MERIIPLLEKYNSFKDASFRKIERPEENTLLITLVTEDDEGEDIDTVKIKFIDIDDATLLENAMLPFLDMMSGVSIIHERGLYAFAVGSSDAMLHIKNSPFFIVSKEIEIQEN